MSEPRLTCTLGGLTKNQSILVTIDDLTEGLVVVSFSHNNNLFQGVLLQLNRERGIPAGISFLKDICTEDGQKDNETDQSQVPPLVRRETYLQDNGSESRSLRRMIKPPDRFIPSRMSLRSGKRPILCAKCGSRCEDKETPQVTANRVPKSKTTVKRTIKRTIKKKKKRGNTRVPAKKSQTILAALKSNTSMPETPIILPVIDDPEDFSYESVGNSGILQNVWNRPLAKPLSYQDGNIATRITLEQCLNKITSHENENPSSPSQNKIPLTVSRNNNNLGNTFTEQIEPTKTPVLKITYCSSENEMVQIQIPPKTTQQSDYTNALESKQTRRAKKKAKKETKKKHLTLASAQVSFEDISPEVQPKLALANLVCDGDEFDRLFMDRHSDPLSFEDHATKKRKTEIENYHTENGFEISGISTNLLLIDTALRREWCTSPAPRNEDTSPSNNRIASPLSLQIFEPCPGAMQRSDTTFI